MFETKCHFSRSRQGVMWGVIIKPRFVKWCIRLDRNDPVSCWNCRHPMSLELHPASSHRLTLYATVPYSMDYLSTSLFFIQTDARASPQSPSPTAGPDFILQALYRGRLYLSPSACRRGAGQLDLPGLRPPRLGVRCTQTHLPLSGGPSPSAVRCSGSAIPGSTVGTASFFPAWQK